MEKKDTPKADDPDVFANIKPRDRRTLVKAPLARTPEKKPDRVSRTSPETRTPVEKPVPAATGERPKLPLELYEKDSPATISDVCVFLRLNGISEVLAYDEFANKLVVLATDKWGLPVGEISDELVVSIVILMQQVDITVTANGVRLPCCRLAAGWQDSRNVFIDVQTAWTPVQARLRLAEMTPRLDSLGMVSSHPAKCRKAAERCVLRIFMRCRTQGGRKEGIRSAEGWMRRAGRRHAAARISQDKQLNGSASCGILFVCVHGAKRRSRTSQVHRWIYG